MRRLLWQPGRCFHGHFLGGTSLMFQRSNQGRTCRHTKQAVALILLFCCAAAWAAPGDKERAKPAKVIIGVVESLFRDVPRQTVRSSTEPFRALMEAQTGCTGDVITVHDPLDLGQRLLKNQVQLGVFYGFEFAWAKQKHPNLKPLVIAVNQHRRLGAHLLARKDSSAADFAGLKGKSLALPAHTKEFCRLFLNHLCHEKNQEPKSFFSTITQPANIEDTLDDVVDGLVQAALVDGVGLERYRLRKPGRFSRLKEVARSAVFPATVVAYRAGALDKATLQRFRTALKNAHESADGRQMLTLWKLTGFEDVPKDYEEQLANIAKRYPAPASRPK